jgi:hypothetical protein
MPCTTVAFANMGGEGHIQAHKTAYLFGYDSLRAARNLYGDVDTHIEAESEESSYLPLYETNKGTLLPVSQVDLFLHRVDTRYTDLWATVVREQQNNLDLYVASIDVHTPVDYARLIQLEQLLYLARFELNDNLGCMNLREYAACTKIEKMTEKVYVELNEAATKPPDVTMWGPDRMSKSGAREKASRYLLHTSHPLHETHCHRLEAKQQLVVLAGGLPPLYPTGLAKDGKAVSKALQDQRDTFGAYIVANYWPFSCDEAPRTPPTTENSTGTALTYNWRGFCLLLDYMYSSEASFMDRGRLSEIHNLAFATRA